MRVVYLPMAQHSKQFCGSFTPPRLMRAWHVGELAGDEIMFLQLIYALSQRPAGCTASNRWLAECYAGGHNQVRCVQATIAKLVEKGFITRQFTPQRVLRATAKMFEPVPLDEPRDDPGDDPESTDDTEGGERSAHGGMSAALTGGVSAALIQKKEKEERKRIAPFDPLNVATQFAGESATATEADTLAHQLADLLRSNKLALQLTKQIRVTPQWVMDMGALLKSVNVSQVSEVLTWYASAITRQNIPLAMSPKELSDKWPKVFRAFQLDQAKPSAMAPAPPLTPFETKLVSAVEQAARGRSSHEQVVSGVVSICAFIRRLKTELGQPCEPQFAAAKAWALSRITVGEFVTLYTVRHTESLVKWSGWSGDFALIAPGSVKWATSWRDAVRDFTNSEATIQWLNSKERAARGVT